MPVDSALNFKRLSGLEDVIYRLGSERYLSGKSKPCTNQNEEKLFCSKKEEVKGGRSLREAEARGPVDFVRGSTLTNKPTPDQAP